MLSLYAGMKNKFYVTTSIAYANARPHIGFALELVQADILARLNRLSGEDVFFLTGTDEHGLKIERKAKEQGKTPSAFADETLLDSFSSDKKFQEDIYIEIKPNSVWNKEPLKTIRDFLNRLAETMTCSMIPIFLALIILKYLIGETHSKTQVASRIWRGKGGHNK